MMSVLLVALGGAVGAVARYKLSGLVLHHLPGLFPWPTFTVNILGCLAMGVLAGLAVREEWFPGPVRLLLFTGILGGFTTFSAFGLEAFYLLQRREVALALAYVGGSVVLGLAALWGGFSVVPHRPPG